MVGPVDTVVMKAILQRGKDQGEHDLEDMEAFVNVINLDKRYLNERLKEVEADERVFKVLRKYGIKV